MNPALSSRIRLRSAVLPAAVLATVFALIAGVLLGATSARADGSATPWAGQDPLAVSGLTFYNAAGMPITSGSTSAAPFAAYVQGRHTTRTPSGFTDNLAFLAYYLPEEGKTPDTWTKDEVVGGSTGYPNAGAPGALATSPLPLNEGVSTDVSLEKMATDYPSTTTTSGYAKVYEVRMYTAAKRKTASLTYDYADISVDTGSHTWSLVYSPSNAGTPAAPTAVNATPGTGSATVSWTAPANGGSAITGYVVEYSTDNGKSYTQVSEATTATSAQITGLTNGTGYMFRVRAVNANGVGEPSANSTSITPTGAQATAPAAPTNVAATAGVTSANVTWTAPTVNGGSAITGYQVEFSRDGGATYTKSPTTVTQTSATVTGLTAGASYIFRVEAINAAGASAPSAPSSAVTPTAATIPGTPTTVTARVGNASSAVSWTAPPSDGGSPITGYVVGYAKSGSDSFTPVRVASATTQATITGLTNGTGYVFRVSAVNAVGTGPASAVSGEVTPAADASALAIGGTSSVRYGYTATILSKLTDSTTRGVLAKQPVTLYGRHARSGRWSVIKTVTTSSTGAASVALKPSSYEQFYWSFKGTAMHRHAASAAKAVTVSQTVAVKATATKIKAKSLIKVYGTVAPSGSGQRAYLQVYNRGWRTVTSAVLRYQTLPNHKRATGFVLGVRPAKGSKVYRVYKPATATLTYGLSGQFKLAGK